MTSGRAELLSIVIPVYKNEENLPRLLRELELLTARSPTPIEVVFVVDGSPDRSLEILRSRLPSTCLQAQLISLSRNFGSFSAVRAGLQLGRGGYFAVLTADLEYGLIALFWKLHQHFIIRINDSRKRLQKIRR